MLNQYHNVVTLVKKNPSARVRLSKRSPLALKGVARESPTDVPVNSVHPQRVEVEAGCVLSRTHSKVTPGLTVRSHFGE